MKRAVRREQQRRVRVRQVRYLWNISGPRGRELILERPWQCINEMRGWVWSTPSWWTHLFMVRRARAETQAQLRLIERGSDPDAVLWPDYHKPHMYYW